MKHKSLPLWAALLWSGIVAVLILMALNGCTDNFNHKPRIEKITSVMYLHDARSNDHRVTMAKKVIMDTLTPVSIDSFNTKKQWVRDSFYFLPFTDTARVDGKPKLDSTGKVMFVLNWVNVNPQAILQDFNKEWK